MSLPDGLLTDVSETVARKAAQLIRDRRVAPLTDAYTVRGTNGTYVVVIAPIGTVCSCPSKHRCSHMVAAEAVRADAQAAA